MATASQPARVDGYAPLADYAAVGDGRTVALVARDGAIDWLCLPNLDSPSVFATLLDPERGGSFTVRPAVPFGVERRYAGETNVLETTFVTDTGAVRVTDALTVPDGDRVPTRELARRIDGLAGSVPMRWSFEPRFGYAQWPTTIERRGDGIPVASSNGEAVALVHWNAGEPACGDGSIDGRFEARDGTSSLLALAVAHEEPPVVPARDDVERRLEWTRRYWSSWAAGCSYDGPWRDAVVRSALALRLLVYSPSGAIAAAATTSLPEAIGGGRNWDYRFSWIRDSSFTVSALLGLGSFAHAEAFFSWLLLASEKTHPWVKVLYRLDGQVGDGERTLPLAGYRRSAPVRAGNDARDQLQLGIYGDVVQTAHFLVEEGHHLDAATGRRLAGIADALCALWSRRDSGIWEVRTPPLHFTHSKMLAWIGLDCALRLAPSIRSGRHAPRWRQEAEAIRRFVEERCVSGDGRRYVRAAGTDDPDASLLLGSVFGYTDPSHPRMLATVDAIRRELGAGPLLYRYRGGDGVDGEEGAFLACSFWLVQALARAGRVDEAAELMEQMLGLANDVGLYSEEIDPSSGELLGNLPQGLTHLAVVNAARVLAGDLDPGGLRTPPQG